MGPKRNAKMDNSNIAYEKLREANLQLTEQNADYKVLIRDYENQILYLQQEVAILHNEVATEKMHNKYMNDKFLSVVRDTYGRYMEACAHTSEPKEPQEQRDAPTQQCRIVRPMIGGMTIDNPVIKLPRVSPEDLERMNGLTRHASAPRALSNVTERTETSFTSDNSSDNNEEELPPRVLATIAEVTEIGHSMQVAGPSSVSYDSLADISNTVSHGHVTKRRGRRRQSSSSDEDVLNSPSNSSTVESENIDTNSSVLTNSVFTQGKPKTSTPLIETVAGSSRSGKRKDRMPSCSVVLKRIATTHKRRSRSPEKDVVEVKDATPKKLARPTRAAKPKYLKEKSLLHKLRRKV